MTSSSSFGGGGGGGSGGDIHDAAEWMRVFEQVEGVQEECRNDINDAQARGLGNRMKRQMAKKIDDSRDRLNRLERSLREMERNPMRFRIGDGELNRRKGLLASLRSINDQLEDQLTHNDGRLAGNLARKPPSLANESADSQQLSNQQLLAQQSSALSAQDEKLDGILDGVSRLKVMSSDINQELDLHANLLTELDHAVDNTDTRMQRSIKRVEIVTEQSGGWCGLFCMILLFGIIVSLLVTDWGCKLPGAKC